MSRARRALVPWAFVTPFLVAFVAFSAWPIWRTLGLSVGPADDPLRFYRLVIFDPLAWLAGANTLAFAVAFSVLQTALATGAALLAEATPRWLGRAWLFVLFSAHVLGATYAGVIFGQLLRGGDGGLNALLLDLGLLDGPVGWLTTPVLAMPVLVAIAAYVGVGFGALWVAAALRRVDREVIEAARVDGAGALGRLWHATLPQLRPTLAMLLVAGLFWGLGVFELPYVLFGGEGPGYRGLTAVMLIFATGFERGQVGYASAAAVLLATATAMLSVALALVLRVGREEVTLA